MATSNHTQLPPEHLAIIEGIARETSCPMEDVENVYAETLGRLSSGARIRDFLTVLTCKKVRDVLRQARKSVMPRDSAMHP